MEFGITGMWRDDKYSQLELSVCKLSILKFEKSRDGSVKILKLKILFDSEVEIFFRTSCL